MLVAERSSDVSEPPHDKTNKMTVRPAKTQIQAFFMRMTKTDQTGQMPRLIWVFAGRTCHFCWLCHEATQVNSWCSVENVFRQEGTLPSLEVVSPGLLSIERNKPKFRFHETEYISSDIILSKTFANTGYTSQPGDRATWIYYFYGKERCPSTESMLLLFTKRGSTMII